MRMQIDESSLKKSVIFDSQGYKGRLIVSLNELLNNVQQNNRPQASSSILLLAIENEGLEYIESIIFDLFTEILLINSNYDGTNANTPEARCAAAIATMAISNNASNALSLVSSSPRLLKKGQSIPAPHSQLKLSDSSLDQNEFEQRVRQLFPHSLAEVAISKAKVNVAEYDKSIPSAKRRIFRNLSSNQSSLSASSSHSSSNASLTGYRSSNNDHLAKIFTLPIDMFHHILSKIFDNSKFDMHLSVYLVSVLELVAKDILRVSSSYVRGLQNYKITKRDITTAINGQRELSKLVNSTLYGSPANKLNRNLSSTSNDFDDPLTDDATEFLIMSQTDGTESENNSVFLPDSASTFGSVKAGMNPEECTSDSSTLRDESAMPPDMMNRRYREKVNELVSEQKLHLTDLNVLRRIFMSLFEKACHEFRIDTNMTTNKDDEEANLIKRIFGNVNDVYEMALKLADLLDEAVSLSSSGQSVSNAYPSFSVDDEFASQQQQQPNTCLVGQAIWDLGEGNEFYETYSVYASTVSQYQTVASSIKYLLSDANVRSFLHSVSPGLVDVCKYLLPKLLLGPIYHAIYLCETVEFLKAMSTDKEDHGFLDSSSDDTKKLRGFLNSIEYVSSSVRPIETSIRILQSDNFRLGGGGGGMNPNGSLSTMSSEHSPPQRALVCNVGWLTDKKWRDLEANVESLRLPSQSSGASQMNSGSTLAYQSANLSISNNNINSSFSNLPAVALSSSSTASFTTASSFGGCSAGACSIRFNYLFEGPVQVSKSYSPAETSSSRLKRSDRYMYLFDGVLVLIKKPITSGAGSYSLTNSKFKQAISLDRCVLRDNDDDKSFTLKVCQQTGSGGSSNPSNQTSQETEYILFMADKKSEWLSFLCYAQYKLTIDRLLQSMIEEHNRNNPLPVPPKGYIFDQPDSPDNILFDQSPTGPAFAQEESDQPHSSHFSDTLQIKAGTLVKLVERLTHHLYFFPKFLHTFLMCFREFCSARELLDLLFQRFDVPDLVLGQTYLNANGTVSVVDRELIKRYKREYQHTIRLKVTNAVKYWIEDYFEEDFGENAPLLEHLKSFIEHVGQTSQKMQEKLTKCLAKKMASWEAINPDPVFRNDELCLADESNFTNVMKIFKMKPYGVSSSSSSSSSPFNQSRSSSTSTNEDVASQASAQTASNQLCVFENNDPCSGPSFESHLEQFYPPDILTIHPVEFARQVTLMEFELFKAIKPSELISQGWNKDARARLSPNVVKLISLTNKLIYWYAKCIVDTPNFEERVAVVQRLLDIAGYFHQMNNFSGIREIYAAFESSSVQRLKLTMEKADIERHKMYGVFKQLFEHHDRGYLDGLKRCEAPALPFIGTHLSIVLKTLEYNKIHNNSYKIQIEQQQQQLSAKSTKLSTSSNSSGSSLSSAGNSEISASRQTLDPDEKRSLSSSPSIMQASGLINFLKYRMLFNFVSDLLQYQKISYKYRVHHGIRAFLLQDIEDCFRMAQNVSSDSDEDNLFETKFNNLKPIKAEGKDEHGGESASQSETAKFKLAQSSANQMVESWLFAKSKQIEPDTIKVPSFARSKVYPLKSPVPSDYNIMQPKGQKTKSSVELKTTVSSVSIKSSSFLAPSQSRVEKTSIFSSQSSTNSPKLGKTLSSQLSQLSGSGNSTSGVGGTIMKLVRSSSGQRKNGDEKSLHKRSNSSIGSNPDDNNETASQKTGQKTQSAVSPTVRSSNSQAMLSPGSMRRELLPPPHLPPPPPPGHLPPSPNSNTTTPTGSSFSSNFFPSSKTLGASAISNAHREKLSQSSADSSSTPNSPPPNYDDVFVNENAPSPRIIGRNQMLENAMNSANSSISYLNSFENKIYVDKFCSSSSLTSSSMNDLALDNFNATLRLPGGNMNYAPQKSAKSVPATPSGAISFKHSPLDAALTNFSSNTSLQNSAKNLSLPSSANVFSFDVHEVGSFKMGGQADGALPEEPPRPHKSEQFNLLPPPAPPKAPPQPPPLPPRVSSRAQQVKPAAEPPATETSQPPPIPKRPRQQQQQQF